MWSNGNYCQEVLAWPFESVLFAGYFVEYVQDMATVCSTYGLIFELSVESSLLLLSCGIRIYFELIVIKRVVQGMFYIVVIVL